MSKVELRAVNNHQTKSQTSVRKFRGGHRTSFFEMHIKKLKMFGKCCPVRAFGQNVRRVQRPQHLLQGEVTGADTILDPEIRHCQMADLAQAPAPANANRGSGIRQHSDGKVKAKILGYSLEAKSF